MNATYKLCEIGLGVLSLGFRVQGLGNIQTQYLQCGLNIHTEEMKQERGLERQDTYNMPDTYDDEEMSGKGSAGVCGSVFS